MPGNARSGRKRRPTAQLKLEGRYHPAKHGDRSGEVAPIGKCEPVEELNADARRLWDAAMSGLPPGAVGIADAPMLTAAATMYGLYCRAVKEANVDPIDRNARAATVAYLNSWERLAGRFGMSPSDRAKLNLESPKAEDKLAMFGVVS